MTERDSFADVGAAMRQAIDRALESGLGPRQWRTFVAVLKYTGTWSKLADRLYLAVLAADVFGVDEPTRHQLDKVGKDLAALAAAGIIERDPPKRGRPSKQSGGPGYRVALPAAEIRPRTAGLSTQNAASPGRNTAEKCGHGGTEMRPPTNRNAAASGRPTEEVSEKTSEEGAEPRPPSRFPLDGALPLAGVATPLVEQHGHEIPGVIARLVEQHGEVSVRTSLGDLARAGRRYRYPSELAKAVAPIAAQHTRDTAAQAARAAENATRQRLEAQRATPIDPEANANGLSGARHALAGLRRPA